MLAALAIFEVMDKEPPLSLVALGSLTTGALGMLTARRRPLLSALFIFVVLLGVFAFYSELSDSFVRESIVKEGGLLYLGGCGIAVLAGVGMPLLGALAGTGKIEQSAVIGVAPWGLQERCFLASLSSWFSISLNPPITITFSSQG